MRELKFKNAGTEYRVESNGVLIKPFYTLDERASIFGAMLSQENVLMEDAVLVIETAKYCTNIDFTGIDNIEIYNICAELGLITDFKLEIEEYMEMYKLLEREKSLYVVADRIVNIIEDKLKDVDVNKLTKTFAKKFTDIKKVLDNGSN